MKEGTKIHKEILAHLRKSGIETRYNWLDHPTRLKKCLVTEPYGISREEMVQMLTICYKLNLDVFIIGDIECITSHKRYSDKTVVIQFERKKE